MSFLQNSMNQNYHKLAVTLLEKVGGKDNVINVYHCVTRLRFQLKDSSIPNTEEIEKIQGVLGVVTSGGQYQIIIGQAVPELYKKVVEIGGFGTQEEIAENLDGGFETQEEIAENLDAPKEKKGIKQFFAQLFEFMCAVMSPMIPAYCAAGLFKTVAVVCGPDVLAIWETTSDLYITFNFAYNACFYFLPIYLGYTAAKKLGLNVILGMYLGGMMLVPEFVEIATTSEAFTILGIPCKLGTYGTTIFPILLSVFALKYVDMLISKVIPQMLSTSIKPFIEMFIMLPLELCLFCPLGTLIGEGIAQVILMLDSAPLLVGIIGGLWPFLILTGMHMPILYAVILPNLYSLGYDTTVLPATLTNQALLGLELAALLKIKNKKERMNVFQLFITHNVGGVSEPVLYGIGMKYKKTLIALAVGGICGGLFAAFTDVVYYLGPSFPLIGNALSFFQGGTKNFILFFISALIACVVTFLLTYFYGFDKNDPMLKKEEG